MMGKCGSVNIPWQQQIKSHDTMRCNANAQALLRPLTDPTMHRTTISSTGRNLKKSTMQTFLDECPRIYFNDDDSNVS